MVVQSYNTLFVGFLEAVLRRSRIGLTSRFGLAKLRNMPHTSKGKHNKMVLLSVASVDLTAFTVRQNMFDPKKNVTFS